jgi:hypothetical protein
MPTTELSAARSAVEAAQRALQAAVETTAVIAAAAQESESAFADILIKHTEWRGRAARRVVEAAKAKREIPDSTVPERDVVRKESAKGMLEAVQEALRTAQTEEAAARKELEQAQAHERALRGQLRQERYDQIASQRRSLWAEDERLTARLFVVALDTDNGHSSIAPLTQEASNVLHSPPLRPSAESLYGGHVLADIHTPRSGECDLISQARKYWAEFDAALEEPTEHDTASERAA